MDAGSILLPTGLLSYQGEPSNTVALAEICDFGARINPRRGFVFISKILGKHWPCRPSEMLEIHHKLAQEINNTDKDPLIFIGMAETATGLGHSVFESFLKISPGRKALFLQTTRYPLDGMESIKFQEEHSHATQQYLYLPSTVEKLDLFQKACTAVLIDDEATSGQTFVNLTTALRSVCPSLTNIVPMVLTDFTKGELSNKISRLEGVKQVNSIALWQGSWEFRGDPSYLQSKLVAASAPVGCRRNHISPYTGRLGIDRAINLPASMIERCAAILDRPVVLVLGTGECMHPAFRLALGLEEMQFNVWIQSTTRSPLMKAGGIVDKIQVEDPYGEGIPNFLYNFSRFNDTRVVVVHETREREHINALLLKLNAIEFNLADHRVELPL